MIIVRVELLSAITGKTTELARMHITNDGTGTANCGNYNARTYRGRCTDDLDRGTENRVTRITNYPRKAIHVWNLVVRALKAMEYNK